jgi:hypothetical protein
MSKIIPILVFSCISLCPQLADAQIKERKIPKETEKTENNSAKSSKLDDYFDESGGFKHHLQYMFHTNYSIFQIFGGSFSLRLDPSIGYKINKWASAGLTTGITYSYNRYVNPSTGVPTALKQIDYSYGVYGRAKVFNSFFIHTDYKLATYERPFQDGAGNIFKLQQANQQECNVGIAYRAGSAGWGTELMLVYDVMHKPAVSFKENPLDFKMGLTYNF